MNRQMNLYYHFFEKKNQLISISCLFLWKTHFPYNERRNAGILVAFSKKKETSLYKLASFERRQLIFRGVKNPKEKKQMKVSESNSKVVYVSQGAGAKRYFQSETD